MEGGVAVGQRVPVRVIIIIGPRKFKIVTGTPITGMIVVRVCGQGGLVDGEE